MSAVIHNLVIEQGATFTKRLTWRDKNKRPINLTGCTGRMQIRAAIGSAVLCDLSTQNGGITLGDVRGTIDLRIEATVTRSFSFDMAVYDLLLKAADGSPLRLMQGEIALSPGVTVDTP